MQRQSSPAKRRRFRPGANKAETQAVTAGISETEPFVLGTGKYESAFGTAGTPLADAIAATVTWYRTRLSTS
jgi:hypothetical protein